MINWLHHTLTLAVVMGFVIGLLVSQLVSLYLYRRHRVSETSSWLSVVAIVIVAAIIWIMVATQQARNCAITLNVSVSEGQRIEKIESDALFVLFTAAINPPADVANLPQDDPARKAWGQRIGAQYVSTVRDAARQRTINEANQAAAQRACGR